MKGGRSKRRRGRRSIMSKWGGELFRAEKTAWRRLEGVQRRMIRTVRPKRRL